MTQYKLSFLIPSNNEIFLARTIQDILQNTSEQSEIIVCLDGKWADPVIPQHPRVNVIYVPESIGQRAATNLACKLSRAKYVAKVDAHCSFDKDWDLKMFEAYEKTGDNVTMVSIMRNLWAFSWNCRDCNWKKYQGPTPPKCEKCGGTNLRKKMMWIGKERPQSTSYCFDAVPHFQYFTQYKHTQAYKDGLRETGLTESMSIQGSCFMCTRDKYWELNLSGEEFGSWGNQGIEVACKTWLSGGRVLINHKTWYAHMFRTQGGDFGFPYSQRESNVQKTKKKVWEFFFGNWDKQIYPMSWLVDRFWPVPGWTEVDRAKLKERPFPVNT
jgi:glycosyltransferase involved in cell wall biosynthesis